MTTAGSPWRGRRVTRRSLVRGRRQYAHRRVINLEWLEDRTLLSAGGVHGQGSGNGNGPGHGSGPAIAPGHDHNPPGQFGDPGPQGASSGQNQSQGVGEQGDGGPSAIAVAPDAHGNGNPGVGNGGQNGPRDGNGDGVGGRDGQGNSGGLQGRGDDEGAQGQAGGGASGAGSSGPGVVPRAAREGNASPGVPGLPDEENGASSAPPQSSGGRGGSLPGGGPAASDMSVLTPLVNSSGGRPGPSAAVVSAQNSGAVANTNTNEAKSGDSDANANAGDPGTTPEARVSGLQQDTLSVPRPSDVADTSSDPGARETGDRTAAALAGPVAVVAGQSVAVLSSWTGSLARGGSTGDAELAGPTPNSASVADGAGAALAAGARRVAQVLAQALPDELDELADLLPIGLATLDEVLEEYVPDIDEIGGTLSSLLAADGVAPWVAGVVVTSASVMVLRRVASRDRRGPQVGEEGGESLSSWLLDVTTTAS